MKVVCPVGQLPLYAPPPLSKPLSVRCASIICVGDLHVRDPAARDAPRFALRAAQFHPQDGDVDLVVVVNVSSRATRLLTKRWRCRNQQAPHPNPHPLRSMRLRMIPVAFRLGALLVLTLLVQAEQVSAVDRKQCGVTVAECPVDAPLVHRVESEGDLEGEAAQGVGDRPSPTIWRGRAPGTDQCLRSSHTWPPPPPPLPVMLKLDPLEALLPRRRGPQKPHAICIETPSQAPPSQATTVSVAVMPA